MPAAVGCVLCLGGSVLRCPARSVLPRCQDGAGVPASAAAARREVQADEDDRHRPSPAGQVHAGGDPADREGAPGDAQRCHHQDNEVGAPQARGAQGKGEMWSEICRTSGVGEPCGVHLGWNCPFAKSSFHFLASDVVLDTLQFCFISS